MVTRRSNTGSTREWMANPSGSEPCTSPMRCTVDNGIEVLTPAGTTWWVSTDSDAAGGAFSIARTSRKTDSSCVAKSLRACSASSTEMSPRPISDSV
jgi:hypothetical protein